MRIAVRGDALVQAHNRQVDGFKEANPSLVLDSYADDVVLMPPNEPSILGKAEAEEWLHEYLQHFQIVDIAPIDRNVTLLGDTAIERWAYEVKIRPVSGDDIIRDEGRFLNIWQRRGGSWLMTQSMWNSVQPIGAGTRRFMSLLKKGSKGRPQD
jgi:ketosteroid isomerase-like protein